MKNLSLILIVLLWNVPLSQAAIEIYSAGRHFDSFEDYQKGGQNPSVQTKLAGSQNVTKKIVPMLDPGQLKLSKLSYNNSVGGVMVNFGQNWQNPKPRFITGAEELEYSIQEALEDQHGAAILISDPNKLRILSYNSKDRISLDNQIHKVDKSVNK
jgi:hypothetical protein